MNQTQTESSVTAQELQRRMDAGQAAFLLDVRTPGEYAAAHVPGTKLIPLDEFKAAAFCRERNGDCSAVYVLCQSGGRARRAIEKLKAAGVQGCVLVEGGIQAWIDAGLPVNRGQSRALPLMRQVQITVGFLTGLGGLLALTVNKFFAIIPLVVGSGLLFAGLTGFCGLAQVLAKMPWNKTSNCNSASGCTTESK
jgi:rhodanese-related sulfurtransferase